MATKCSVKKPWHVILEDRLPKELFIILEEVVSKTRYSLITVKTQKNCVFAFTSRIGVRRVFCALTDQNLTKESLLKRIIKGEKRVEAIIDEEKQFGMRYIFDKEILTIDHYYGYWNDHG